ncbi:Gfo/Idh/MocA family protein [Streptococcus hongkongensis]|nr:oxidoreductase [Streptococcus uberis]
MLEIGIVGLGGISQKAYLPYMRQLPDIHWHLSTRNQEVRQEVANLLGQVSVYNDVNDLSQVKLDGVFIHVATMAHFEVAKLFLEKGIPVYMDKPLTEDFWTSKKLYQIAEDNQTFLMAGFNRRFAPRVKEVSIVSNKRKVTVEKNDVNRPGLTTFKLFDFFIHPLDTALFLAEGRLLNGNFHIQKVGNELCQVTVNLVTSEEIIHVGMNLQSGSRREVIEVQTPEQTYHLENLDDLTVYTGPNCQQIGFASWDTTLYKRGFETIIQAFLEAIATKHNPISPESSLLSHWICDQINKSNDIFGQLDLTLPE